MDNFSKDAQLHAVVYKFYITDAARVEEVYKQVRFDIGQDSIEYYASNKQNFSVTNLEGDPGNNSDEFPYAWEWVNEKFPDCLKLVMIDY